MTRSQKKRKSRRLEILMAKQREIQITNYKKFVGDTLEVMVEGYNEAAGPVDRAHFAK